MGDIIVKIGVLEKITYCGVNMVTQNTYLGDIWVYFWCSDESCFGVIMV